MNTDFWDEFLDLKLNDRDDAKQQIEMFLADSETASEKVDREFLNKIWGKNPKYKAKKSKTFQAFEKLLLEGEAQSVFFHYFCVRDIQKFLCKSYTSEFDPTNPVYGKAMFCTSCLTAFYSGIFRFQQFYLHLL